MKPLVSLTTSEGHSLRLTADHRVRRISTLTRFRLVTEWCAAGDLKRGRSRAAAGSSPRRVVGRRCSSTMGTNEGYLMGLLVGDGTVAEDRAELSIWARPAVGNSDIDVGGPHSVMAAALDAARCFNHRADFSGWHPGTGRGEFRLRMGAITELSRDVGLRPGRKTITPAIERASSEFYRGFLRGLFDTERQRAGQPDEGCVGAPRATPTSACSKARSACCCVSASPPACTSARSMSSSSPARTSPASRKSWGSPTRSSARASRACWAATSAR